MSEVFLGNLKKSPKIRVGLSYSLASIVDSVVAMFVSFLNMRLLGPEILGIWQSITIVNSYLPFAQLGIQSGLNLELPILGTVGKCRNFPNKLIANVLNIL